MAAFALSYPVSVLLDRVHSWAADSQQGARRNAMVACNTLAARRAEREDVEEYLAQLASPAPGPAAEPVAASTSVRSG